MSKLKKAVARDYLTRQTGHDLLNIFSVISANASMLAEDVALGEHEARRLERISEACLRGEKAVLEIRGSVKKEEKLSDVSSEIKGKVLVVDDEKEVVEIIRRHLTKIGLEVEGQVSSYAALESFRQAPHSFDLIITDNDMPILKGIELCGEVKTLRPDVPIIMITGFDSQPKGRYGQNELYTHLLNKPFEKASLISMVHSILSTD